VKQLGLFFALATALSACIPVAINQNPPGPTLVISDLRFSSNYRDSAGNSYICDNKFTTLTYSFRFSDFNLLSRWESRLVGETTGQVTNTLSTDKNSNQYILSGNQATVNWVLGQGVAPLNVSPQGIVVTPVPQPRIIGRTRLELRVFSVSGNSAFVQLPGIPVIDNCP